MEYEHYGISIRIMSNLFFNTNAANSPQTDDLSTVQLFLKIFLFYFQ